METNLTDDVEDDNEDDDEKINLTELLDEMMLTGAATETTEDVTGDSILTAEQAAQIAGIHLSTSGFEAADFVSSDFKFTWIETSVCQKFSIILAVTPFNLKLNYIDTKKINSQKGFGHDG